MEQRSKSFLEAAILLAAAALLALAFSSCGTSGFGARDGEVDWLEEDPPRGTIIFGSESETTLGHGQIGEIFGRYLDPAGEPAPAAMTFSLLGNAYDSTLVSTTGEAGSDGLFSVKVRAGSVDTQFNLRAVAADGAKSEIAINVVSSDNGIVKIQPAYDGRRAVNRWDVALYEPTTCPPTGIDPTFASAFSASEAPSTFSHLPEAATFTVSVLGSFCDDPDDTGTCQVWVEGCKEDVRDDQGQDLVSVDISDDPGYFAADYFYTHTTLNAENVLGGRIEEMLAALAPFNASCEAIAEFILNEIQNAFELDAEKQTIFLLARQESGMDGLVADILRGSGAESFTYEISALRNLLSSTASGLPVSGRLDESVFWPTDPGEEITANHVLESISAGGRNIMNAILGGDTNVSLLAISYDRDVASLGPHSFPIGGGTLLQAISTQVYIPELLGFETGTGTFEQWLSSHIDCASIADRIVQDDAMVALTSPDDPLVWYQARCSDILDGTNRNILLHKEQIDTQLPALQISGSADFLQEDGTPREGRTASGAWSEASWGSEALTGLQSFTLSPSSTI